MRFDKLTMEQKIGLLYYERGAFGLMTIDHYEELKYNPTPIPDPRHVYFGDLFNIDYTKEIIENGDFFNFCQKANIKKIFKLEWNNLNDSLESILYTFIKSKSVIDENFVKHLDKALLDLYNKVMNLKVQEEYIFIPSGMVLNGEELYKRVQKSTQVKDGQYELEDNEDLSWMKGDKDE